MAAIDGATSRTFTFCHPDEEENSSIKATVEVIEAPNSDFGLFLWPSGEVLAWYLWKCPEVMTIKHGRHVKYSQ